MYLIAQVKRYLEDNFKNREGRTLWQLPIIHYNSCLIADQHWRLFFLKQNAIVLDLLPPKRNIGIERDFKTKNQGRADNFFSFPFITETDFKC